MLEKMLFKSSFALLIIFISLFSVALPFKGSNTHCASLQDKAQDWSGCFYEIFGERPQGFEEFINFFVISFPDQPLSGGLSTKAKRSSYMFAAVKIAGDRLTFTTVSFEGIKYSFEGQLLKSPKIENGEIVREPIVEGLLRKYRWSKQVAESKVSLACVAAED